MRKNKNITNFIFFITFTLLIFISKPGKTQELSLFKDLGLYGGQITSLAIDPTNAKVMYAGSWMGDGVFKSENGGATWFTIPQNNPSWFRNEDVNDIEIDPNDTDTIWVAYEHYVAVSHDAGTTWETFYFASDEDRFCYSVAVDPFDSERVYVGTGGPNDTDMKGVIFITEDGGVKWSNQSIVFDTLVWNNFLQIKFNTKKQGEIWAVNRKYSDSPCDGQVFMSTDYAKSWFHWSSALWDDTVHDFGCINDILVHPVNPLRIFLSSDEGIAVKTDGSAAKTPWYWTVDTSSTALCIPPKEPDTIYAALASTMAKSTDNGVTWDTTSLSLPCEFQTMKPHPDNPAVLFAGSLNQGIYTTTDRAQNWTTINNGIKANAIFDTALHPANPGTILCGTLAGVFLKSADALLRINTRMSAAVAFHPSNPNIIYAGFDWGIGKSTDKGATWTYFNTPFQEANEIVSLAIYPTGKDSAIIYAAVYFYSGKKGQILKIQDNGGSITAAPCSIIFESTVPVNAVAFNPHDPSVIIAATGSFNAPASPGGIYISKNSGQTWRKIFLTGKFTANCIAFDPANPDIIYVGCGEDDGTHQVVLKSTNGGQSWRSVISGLPRYFAVSDIKVADDGVGTVYAALYTGYSDTEDNLGGIYVSLNGGKYWTRMGLSDYVTYDVNIESPDAGNLSPRAKAAITAAGYTPTYTVYAGTASGLLTQDQSTIAGMGIISGMITSTFDNAKIGNASVQSTAGTGAQSDQGFYLMLVPSGQHSIQASAPGFLQVSSSSVYVNAGGTTELNITMTPEDNKPTLCISDQLLQRTADSNQLQPLRALRDSILKKTELGKTIISRYYSLGKDVLPVLLGNAHLKTQCLKLLGSSAEIAHTAASGKNLLLPPGFMDKASSFLFALEKASPAELQKKIRTLRCDLRHFNVNRLQARQ